MSFGELSRPGQVARLRVSALEALRAYPLTARRLTLLNHGFNTTFRVDTEEGGRFALRLNVNSRRTPAQIAAEMAWLDALGRDTGLSLPVPQRTREGRLLAHVWNSSLQRELPAALFSWLPGRDLGRDLSHPATPVRLREVGGAAATLHAHARRWSPPRDAALHSLQDPLMGMPNNLDAPHEHLTSEGRAVVLEVKRRAGAVLDQLYTCETPRALHADLHLWNVKWHRGRLSVFDFDDSGLGLPVQDLAISAYYLRPRQELEDALLEGYTGVSPLPDFTREDYETLVAGRGVLLLNDLLVNTTADLREVLPRYVPNSVKKLRHFLETGKFRHDLPGLIAAS